MIPGIDLLNSAFSVIDSTTVAYRRAESRSLNEEAIYVSSYGEPFALEGSVQRVPSSKYHELGLDLQKRYVTLFTSYDTTDLGRGTQGDQFVWEGRTWQLESEGDWFHIDGWTRVQAVDIGPAKFEFDLGEDEIW